MYIKHINSLNLKLHKSSNLSYIPSVVSLTLLAWISVEVIDDSGDTVTCYEGYSSIHHRAAFRCSDAVGTTVKVQYYDALNPKNFEIFGFN